MNGVFQSRKSKLGSETLTRKSHDAPYSDEQLPVFVKELQKAFAKFHYTDELIAHERSRFENIARDMLTWLQERQDAGYKILGREVEATYTFEDLNFTIQGTADLIERGPLGYALFDFKTGEPASAKEVAAGFDPQLPLSAYLAQHGAFENTPAAMTYQLGYVRVKGSNSGFKASSITAPDTKAAKEAMVLAEEAAENLCALIANFDQAATGFPSQPRVKWVNKFGDFDHLARRAEWAGIIDNGEGG